MKRILINIVILFLCCCSISKAQSSDLDSVVQSYVDLGYLDCTAFESQDGLQVVKGLRYIVDKFIILPFDTISLQENTYFIKNEIERQILRLVRKKISEGYLYHNYTPNKIIKHDSTVTIVLAENISPRPRLASVRFEGLNVTDEKQLNKYLSYDSLTFLTEKKLKMLEDNVSAIPYIVYTPPPLIQVRPGYTDADLILMTKEKRMFELEGSVGYLSDKDELLWMGDLTLQNLFGKGKKVDIFSQKINSENQNLSIKYWQPSFLFGVGGIDFTVSTRDYRNQFYEFSLQSQALYKVRTSLKLGAKLSYKTVEPDAQVGSFSVYGATFLADYSNSSFQHIKNNQYRITWELSYAARRQNLTDSLQSSDVAYDDTRIQIGMKYKLPLFLKTSFFNQIQYLGFETKDNLPPLSELFLVGGEKTIRGFRDEQFAVIRAFMSTAEFHVHFKSGYMFTFFDAAYLYNRTDKGGSVINDEYYRFGYGIGVLFENKGGQIQISFGWNKDLPFDQPRLSVQFQTGL